MTRKIVFVGVMLASLLGAPLSTMAAESLAHRLKGYLLLQVEAKGEGWYVSTTDEKRYYLGRPENAFAIMRHFGVGITNRDLNRMPIGLMQPFTKDTDGDGLSDRFEQSQGLNKLNTDTDADGYSDRQEIINGHSPMAYNSGKLTFDTTFTNSKKGMIFLQVESLGEAWYVNPMDGKRYYIETPAQLLAMMQNKNFGLGISNANLDKIPVGYVQVSQTTPSTPSTPSTPTTPVTGVDMSKIVTTSTCGTKTFSDFRTKEDLLISHTYGPTMLPLPPRELYEQSVRPKMQSYLTPSNVENTVWIDYKSTAYSYDRAAGVIVDPRGSSTINLQGLECATWLTDVTVANYTLTSLVPVTSLPNVQKLTLSNVIIPNSYMGDNYSVKELVLTGVSMEDFSNLQKFKNVEKITFRNMNVPNMAYVAALPNLREVTFDRAWVYDWFNIRRFLTTTKVTIMNMSNVDLLPVGDMPTVRNVDLIGSTYQNMSSLYNKPITVSVR